MGCRIDGKCLDHFPQADLSLPIRISRSVNCSCPSARVLKYCLQRHYCAHRLFRALVSEGQPESVSSG